jgi:Fe-S-cluster containining protein
MELATQDEVDWSLEDVARKLIKRRIVFSFDADEQMFTFEQISGRDCIFLDPLTRQCTVYEKRPDTCRNFPKIGPRPGFCPHKPRTG